MECLRALDYTTAEENYARYAASNALEEDNQGKEAEMIWSTLENCGYKGGAVLVTGAGRGEIAERAPKESSVTQAEADTLKSRIAGMIAGSAETLNTGAGGNNTKDESYEAVIAIWNERDEEGEDLKWKREPDKARDSAIRTRGAHTALKAIEKAKPGAVIILRTTTDTADSETAAQVRRYITESCEIVAVSRTEFRNGVRDTYVLRKYATTQDRASFLTDKDYTNETLTPFLTAVTQQSKEGEEERRSENSLMEGMKTDGEKLWEHISGQIEERKRRYGNKVSNTDRRSAYERKDEGKGYPAYTTGRMKDEYVTGTLVLTGGRPVILVKDKDGRPHYREDSKSSKANPVKVQMYLEVRDATIDLLKVTAEGGDTTEARKRLQERYEQYVSRNDRLFKSASWIMEDAMGGAVLALERTKTYETTKGSALRTEEEDEEEDEKTRSRRTYVTELTGMSDLYNGDIEIQKEKKEETGGPEDAVKESLRLYGEIRGSHLESRLGANWYERLDGKVLRETDGTLLEREEYLSGDTVTRLEKVQQAGEGYERETEALLSAQPRMKELSEIPVELGARWIGTDIINRFLRETYSEMTAAEGDVVTYDPLRSEYTFNWKAITTNRHRSKYSALQDSAEEIAEKAITSGTITHTTTVKGKTIINNLTVESGKQARERLRDDFRTWVALRPDVAERIKQDYNRIYNRTTENRYERLSGGEGLSGMTMKGTQRRAVGKLMSGDGGIVDHAVGAGKTLVMQTLAMELRRTGRARKPMMIVKSSTREQIRQSFQQAYPLARIYAPTEADMNPGRREETMRRMAENDYDCILLSHDQFKLLPHSRLTRLKELSCRLEEELREETKGKKETDEKEKRIKSLRKAIRDIKDEKGGEGYTFETTGVDHLMVDECQAFKNLRYESQYNSVAGMGPKKGSGKAEALLRASEHLHLTRGEDKGLTLASATVITNSFTELYAVMRYMMPGKLRRMGLNTFDAWAATFARVTEEIEYEATGEMKQRARFRKFASLDMLQKIYAERADIVTKEELRKAGEERRPEALDVTHTLKATEQVKRINEEIRRMVRDKDGSYFNIPDRNSKGGPQNYTLHSLDIADKNTRSPMIFGMEDRNGKIDCLCKSVAEIHRKTAAFKGVQLIFNDKSVKKKGEWSVSEEIAERLVREYGIRREEIADIHDYDSDYRRKQLFDDANSDEGTVRIIIGSTENLGTGVNVQRKAVAEHLFDLTWTPSAEEQKTGRVVRPGNEAAFKHCGGKVEIHRYIMENTIDLMKMDVLTSKQKMIESFQKGEMECLTDATEMMTGKELTYEQVLSAMQGDDTQTKITLLENRLERMVMEEKAFNTTQMEAKVRKEVLKERIETTKERIERIKRDLFRLRKRAGYEKNEKGEYPAPEVTFITDGKTEIARGVQEIGKRIKEMERGGGMVSMTTKTFHIEIEPHPVAEPDGRRLSDMVLTGESGEKYRTRMQDNETSRGMAPSRLLQMIEPALRGAERDLERLLKEEKECPEGDLTFTKSAEIRNLREEIKGLRQQKAEAAERNNESLGRDARERMITNNRYTMEKGKEEKERDRQIMRTLQECLRKAGITVNEFTEEEKARAVRQTGTERGYAFAGEIHINSAEATPGTYIHEYTHLWCAYMQREEKARWRRITDLLEDTPYWREVQADINYASIWDDRDRLASETLARLSGERGEKWMRSVEAKGEYRKAGAKAASMFRTRARAAIRTLWGWVSEKLDFRARNANELADMVLSDLLDARHLKSEKERQTDRLFADPATTMKERERIMEGCADASLGGKALRGRNGKILYMEKADREGRMLISYESAERYRREADLDPEKGRRIEEGIRREMKQTGAGEEDTENLIRAIRRDGNERVFVTGERMKPTFKEEGDLTNFSIMAEGMLIEIASPKEPARQLYSTALEREVRGMSYEEITDRFNTLRRERESLIIGVKGAGQLDRLLYEGQPDRIDFLKYARDLERSLEAAGHGRDDIERRTWQATGWQRGADGKWRCELPDNDKSALEAAVERAREKGEGTAVCRIHDIPEMKALYPEDDGSITIHLTDGWSGSLYERKEAGREARIHLTYGTKTTFAEQMEHELEHHCQDVEGFAGGTTIGSIEEKKTEIARTLGIRDVRDMTASGMASRYAEADEETKRRVEEIADQSGVRLPDLMALEARRIYLDCMGEAEAENSAVRLMLSEAEKMQTAPNDTLVRDRDDLWAAPRAMSAAAEGTYLGTPEYRDPEDEREEWEEMREAESAPKDEETLRLEQELARKAREKAEKARADLERHLDERFKSGEAVLYCPMSREGYEEFMKRGCRLTYTDRLTAEPARATDGQPVVLRIRLKGNEIKERICGMEKDGSYRVKDPQSLRTELHSLRQSSEATYWENRLRFCRKDITRKRATVRQTGQMVRAIEAVFPREMRGRTRLLDTERYTLEVNARGGDGEGSIAFTSDDGTVLINRDEARVDTPLHELGVHRMADLARRYGIREIEDAILTYGATAPSGIKEEVDRLYPDLEKGGETYLEECAALAMGAQQEGRLAAMLEAEGEKGWAERLAGRISRCVETLRDTVLGRRYADLSVIECLEGMSHEVIGEHLFSIVMSGKRIDLRNRRKQEGAGTAKPRHQIIGMKGAERLALSDRSPDALTSAGLTLTEALERYRRMRSEGVTDHNTLTTATGVMFGPKDGLERWEIMDAPLIKSGRDLDRLADGSTERGVGEYFGEGCALMKAYPEIARELRITAKINPQIQSAYANVQEDIALDGTASCRVAAFCRSEEELLGKIVHETQHYIQKKEGFDEGYPFLQNINGKEIMYLQEKLASRTSEQIKEASRAPLSEFAEKGVRRRNVEWMREAMSKGKSHLEKTLGKINEEIEKYVYCAGENEAIAAERRARMSREERIARRYDEHFLAPAESLRKSPINEFKEKLRMYSLFTPTLTFKELRERISIAEIAETYGYVRLKGEGVRVPIYRHESGDRIAILNPGSKSEQGYFTIGDDADKGTLYNFIATRVSKGIIPNPLPAPESDNPNFVVNKIAHDYLRLPVEKRGAQMRLIEKATGKAGPVTGDYMRYTKEMEQNEFLKDRGLQEAAALPEFKGRVLSLDREAMEADRLSRTAGAENLVAFPYTDSEGRIKAMEKRGDGVKMFFAGSRKAEGVWMSNIPEGGVRRVVICETPLDAMSYRVLRGEEKGTLYAATGGNVCATQIEELLKTADRNGGKDAEVVCACDRDAAGARFNLRITAEVMRHRAGTVTDLLPTSEGRSRIMVSFKSAEGKRGLENILENAAESIRESGTDIRVEEMSAGMKESVVIAYGSNDRFAASTLTALLQSTREGYGISTHHPMLKDMNEDLMMLSHLNRERGANLDYRGMLALRETILTDPDAIRLTETEVSRKEERKRRGMGI